MEQLITAIYNLFNSNIAVFENLNLQPVRTVDRYRGQTTQPEKFEFYPTPAVFISTRTAWALQGKTYEGTLTVELHVLTDEPTETGSIYTNHEEALKQTHFYSVVQQLLDGLTTPHTTPLIRQSDADVDTGVVTYNILTYTCKTFAGYNKTNTIEVNGISIEVQGKGLVKQL